MSTVLLTLTDALDDKMELNVEHGTAGLKLEVTRADKRRRGNRGSVSKFWVKPDDRGRLIDAIYAEIGMGM